MTSQEIEEQYIRSLDVPMTSHEKEVFSTELKKNTALAKQLTDHKKIREVLYRESPVTFGPFFAARIAARIENTGVIIERQIFSFFKKYQLLAAGVIVGLLILNTVFAEQTGIDSTFGLENTTTTTTTTDINTNTSTTDEILSFDFYKTLNNDL